MIVGVSSIKTLLTSPSSMKKRRAGRTQIIRIRAWVLWIAIYIYIYITYICIWLMYIPVLLILYRLHVDTCSPCIYLTNTNISCMHIFYIKCIDHRHIYLFQTFLYATFRCYGHRNSTIDILGVSKIYSCLLVFVDSN
jgi:hypothetical protein